MKRNAHNDRCTNATSDEMTLRTRSVRRSFDRAGAGYDAVSIVQTAARESLLRRLDLTGAAPLTILDAGAGTGQASDALYRRYPESQVIALDSALGMLHVAGHRQSLVSRFHRVCADAQHLPLATGSVDLIISNLMLQWCDPDAVFAEFRRVLAPSGSLSFTTLGPGTLRELRASWAAVDSHAHVNRFIDVRDLGVALARAGFATSLFYVEHYTLTYAKVRELAMDLKAIGAHHVTAGRSKGLTGPRKFAAMEAAYEGFRCGGRLPATYEVLFGQALGSSAIVTP
jgi:malonyl-CoA O-methyltransferase